MNLPAEFWIWYLMLFIMGIVMIPATRYVFGRFFYDYGYPFAKTFSIIAVSFVSLLLGMLHIVPFSFYSLAAILGLIAVGNFFLLHQQLKETADHKKPYIDNRQFFIILVQEVTFLVALAFLTIVRAQEPSIRGLEKFMDFGFMNSLLRSDFFPPLDMWLSADEAKPEGYPINYYYFGHLMGAMLIKLSTISPFIGYNLVLATVFAQGITLAFSLSLNIVFVFHTVILKTKKAVNMGTLLVYGFLGSFIVNLAGNLHTIYLFTTGYPNDDPQPFWTVMKSPMQIYNEIFQIEEAVSTYWYPNATRFIPYTIHEFPSYSYVVADLHGHVYGIPIVLSILSVLFIVYLTYTTAKQPKDTKSTTKKPPDLHKLFQEGSTLNDVKQFIQERFRYEHVSLSRYSIGMTALLGSLIGIAYTTNALDGPIYLLLMLVVFLFIFQISLSYILHVGVVVGSFFVTVLPFSLFFSPFASGVGVNCSPGFLTNIGNIGMFVFEEGNCQVSPFWMLFVLWGFFWVSFVLLLVSLLIKHHEKRSERSDTKSAQTEKKQTHAKDAKPLLTRVKEFVYSLNTLEGNLLDIFALLLFGIGTFLVLVPELFYIKDIYPAHFRANTMFKLGYQAFIMMGVASTYAFFRLRFLKTNAKYLLNAIFLFFFGFVLLYPFYAFPSYYPGLNKIETYFSSLELDGTAWMKDELPDDRDVIFFFHENVDGQPVILEAQGDSYTDYNRVSAYTGLPTVAGWWVHQWLWRGSADIVGARAPDISTIYESDDLAQTETLLEKYQVSYVIISDQEREKYPNLNEEKFMKIGEKIFTSQNNVASIYKITHEE
jgi:YYY domain-containing protein